MFLTNILRRLPHAGALILACGMILFIPMFVSGNEDEREHDHDQSHSEEGAAHDDEGHADEESVRLSFEEINEFGIILDTAGPGWIRTEITLPGEVKVNADRFAHVSPRFPGLVKRVVRTVGDSVRANETLAIVESNESLTDFEVRSLIDGIIIEKHIVVGEITSSETEAFTVADLSSVWVTLNVFPMHLNDVRRGQNVVVTPDHGVHEVSGVISYVSPTVDEHSRTATARIVIDNPDGFWRPGQFVEGIVEVARAQAPLVVPRSAIFTYENSPVVFVFHDGDFEPHPVTISQKDSHYAEILSGLKTGDVFAARGGFTIKSQLKKGSFKSGHSH